MNEATLKFIEANQHADIHSLGLQASKYPDVDMSLALCQITGKQKVKEKIPVFYDCGQLLYPVRLSLEQSSSEITAKYKTQWCGGNCIIDLTGGFGVDSYFFSQKFVKVKYVERDNGLCTLATHNFRVLGQKNIEIINELAEDYLSHTESADWIYLDPARRSNSGSKVFRIGDCDPDVASILDKLLSKTDNIMVKLSPMIDISTLINDLKFIVQIHIVAVENECKEVLVILKKNCNDEIEIKTINYRKNRVEENFDFLLKNESSATSKLAENVGRYLYEPNAAIMKSGAFRLTGEKFHLNKLHISSHLYTSDLLVSDFPGRSFEVKQVYDFNKNSLKHFERNINAANITVRNFPLSVADLRKKLKIKEGGDDFIFATTLALGDKALILCQKI